MSDESQQQDTAVKARTAARERMVISKEDRDKYYVPNPDNPEEAEEAFWKAYDEALDKRHNLTKFREPEDVHLSTKDGKAQLYTRMKGQQKSMLNCIAKITKCAISGDPIDEFECRQLCEMLLSKEEIHRDTRVETLHILAQLPHTNFDDVYKLLRDVEGILRYCKPSDPSDPTARYLLDGSRLIQRRTDRYRLEHPDCTSVAQIDQVEEEKERDCYGHIRKIKYGPRPGEEDDWYTDPYKCTHMRKWFC